MVRRLGLSRPRPQPADRRDVMCEWSNTYQGDMLIGWIGLVWCLVYLVGWIGSVDEQV